MCGLLSPVLWFAPHALTQAVNNHQLLPRLFPDFSPTLSPLKIAVSPLLYSEFYPLSTAPTITKSKEI